MLAYAKAAPASGFLFMSGNDNLSITYVRSALPPAQCTWHTDMCVATHMHKYPAHRGHNSAQLFSKAQETIFFKQGQIPLSSNCMHLL